MTKQLAIAERLFSEYNALQHLRLSHPRLFWSLLFVAFVLLTFTFYDRFWGIPKLHQTISDQNQQIILLETQLGPFKTIALEKYTGSEGEALKLLAEHISKIDASLTKTKQELLRRTSDRIFTEEQTQTLKSALKNVTGKVSVRYNSEDFEAMEFWFQISNILATTALEIVDTRNDTVKSLPFAKGLIILTKDKNMRPPHFHVVKKSFDSIGFELNDVSDYTFAMAEVANSLPEDVIAIWVARK